MKNINDKTKKWLVVSSGLLISLVLIFMISSKFQKEPIEETILPNQEKQASEKIVETLNDKIKIDKEDTADKEKSIDEVDNINSEENGEKEDIEVEKIKIPDTKPNDKNGVDKGTEQTIQKKVEKPKEPTKEQLKDPTHKPNGEKVTEPPKNVDHEKVEKPKEPPKKKDDPKGGDTNSKGQTYMPGFGWVENSGENKGTEVDGDGDINKQIGDMN